MNRKMIMLVGILVCGSFGVMMGAERLMLKYQQSKLTAADNTLENIRILNEKIREIERGKMYPDYYPYEPVKKDSNQRFAEELALLSVPFAFTGGAFLDYTGRGAYNLFDYLAHKKIFSSQEAILEDAGKGIRALTSIAKVPLFTWAGLVVACYLSGPLVPVLGSAENYIGYLLKLPIAKINNYRADRKIAFIKKVINAIKAASVK